MEPLLLYLVFILCSVSITLSRLPARPHLVTKYICTKVHAIYVGKNCIGAICMCYLCEKLYAVNVFMFIYRMFLKVVLHSPASWVESWGPLISASIFRSVLAGYVYWPTNVGYSTAPILLVASATLCRSHALQLQEHKSHSQVLTRSDRVRSTWCWLTVTGSIRSTVIFIHQLHNRQ